MGWGHTHWPLGWAIHIVLTTHTSFPSSPPINIIGHYWSSCTQIPPRGQWEWEWLSQGMRVSPDSLLLLLFYCPYWLLSLLLHYPLIILHTHLLLILLILLILLPLLLPLIHIIITQWNGESHIHTHININGVIQCNY